MSRLPARRFGPYQLLRVLGEGGMGVVYEARQDGLKRSVALKVLLDSWLNQQDVHLRFVREMKLMASLSHPNLVKIYDGGEIDGRAYIAMELVEGESLAERAVRDAPIPWKEVIEWVIQIADGLDHLHRQRILHRDIKPSNLLLDRRGTLKILDFGLAQREGGTLLTEEGSTVGTASYIAPEVILGEPMSEASDMWALGISLHFLLTGTPAVHGQTMPQLMERIVNVSIPPVHSIEPRVPPAVSDLVGSLLQRSAAARPPASRLREMADEILVSMRTARAPTAAPEQRSAIEPPQSQALLWVTRVTQALTLALVGLALWIAWRSAGSAPAPPVTVSATIAPTIAPSPSPARIVSIFDQWRVLLPDIQKTIQQAEPAIQELRRKTSVDLGDRPEVWRFWAALGEWLEREGDTTPPRLPGSRGGAPDPFVYRVARYRLDEVEYGHGPELLGLAVRGIAMGPDGAGAWLLLGRLLDWEGKQAQALRIYRHALPLLPEDNVESWTVHYWAALVHALRRVEGAGWMSTWWSASDRTTHKDRVWWGARTELRDAFPTELRRVVEEGLRRPDHFDRALIQKADLMISQEDRREALDMVLGRMLETDRLEDVSFWAVHEALVQGDPERIIALAMHVPEYGRPVMNLAVGLAAPPDPHPQFRPSSDRQVAAVEILRLVEIGALAEAERAFGLFPAHPSRSRLALELITAGSRVPAIIDQARAAIAGHGGVELCMAPSVPGPACPLTLDELLGNLDLAPVVRAVHHARRGDHTKAVELLKTYPGPVRSAALELEAACWASWAAMIGRPADPASVQYVTEIERGDPKNPFSTYRELLRVGDLAAARKLAERFWVRQPAVAFWKVAVLMHAVQARDLLAFEHWHRRNVASVRFLVSGLWVIGLGHELRRSLSG